MFDTASGGGDLVTSQPPPITKDTKQVTLDQLRGCVPLNIRKNLKQGMVDLINSSCDDTEERDRFRENVLTWADVLGRGKWKFKDYICAVRYVSHKLMGDGNTIAYAKVFPNRYQRMVNKGYDSKKISAHTTMYNKTDLVSKIVERTLQPIWVLNSDILQEAINTQAELMRSAKSETVRHKAAANLIENLKKPESIEVELNVGVSNDTVEDLRAVTRALATQQKLMIEQKQVTAFDVAGSDIIVKSKADEEHDVIEAEFESVETLGNQSRSRLVSDFYRDKEE